MRTLASACSVAALVGLAACNDPDCLENERKIGAVCHPIAGREDASTAATTGNVSAGDGGLLSGPAIDAGGGSSPDGSATTGSSAESLDAQTPVATSEALADAQAVAPATGPATLADAASVPATPLPCDGGAVNGCGGCDVLVHAREEACSNGGQGPCALPGTYQCLGTQLLCNAPPATPSAEVCDGKDNDCNGQTDEGVLNACKTCGDVPAEVCDGKDNNCDGKVDEGVLNACGVCGAVPAEVCDGKDNNCDGKVDEGVVLNACGACGAVPVEVCDGKDNDCDGQIDEGVLTTWYPDCDGDGYAALDGSVAGCAMPAVTATCKGYLSTMPVFKTTLDCRDDSVAYNPEKQLGDYSPAVGGTGGYAGALKYDFDCDGILEVADHANVDGQSVKFCADPKQVCCMYCSAITCADGTGVTTANCGQTSNGERISWDTLVCNHYPSTRMTILCH